MNPPHPAGDPKGPPNPSSSTLAPTDCPASRLASRLRLMPIFAGERESRATAFCGRTRKQGDRKVGSEKAGRPQGCARTIHEGTFCLIRPYIVRAHPCGRPAKPCKALQILAVALQSSAKPG